MLRRFGYWVQNRFDERGGFERELANFCTRHIRQEFITADNVKFDGVAQRLVAVVESPVLSAQVQAK